MEFELLTTCGQHPQEEKKQRENKEEREIFVEELRSANTCLNVYVQLNPHTHLRNKLSHSAPHQHPLNHHEATS